MALFRCFATASDLQRFRHALRLSSVIPFGNRSIACQFLVGSFLFSLISIPVSELCQRKDSEEELAALANSIHRHGLLQIPTVVDNGDNIYTVIAGRRRYRVCNERLRWETMPCHVIRVTKAEGAMLSYAENMIRQKPSPLEEARWLHQIKQVGGLSDEQIAEEYGVSQSYVTDRLRSLLLGEDILRDIKSHQEGKFRFTHAVELSRIVRMGRFNAQIEVRRLKNKVMNHGVSARELRSVVKLMEGKDNDYDRLPDQLKDKLLEDKYMTADMARFCLHPEEAVQGQDERAKQLKVMAQRLAPKEMEKFILQAVKQRLTVKEAKDRLVKMQEKRLLQEEDQSTDVLEAWKVRRQIARWNDDIERWQAQIFKLEESGTEELDKLRRTGDLLVQTWQMFARKLKEVEAEKEAVPTAN